MCDWMHKLTFLFAKLIICVDYGIYFILIFSVILEEVNLKIISLLQNFKNLLHNRCPKIWNRDNLSWLNIYRASLNFCWLFYPMVNCVINQEKINLGKKGGK